MLRLFESESVFLCFFGGFPNKNQDCMMMV